MICPDCETYTHYVSTFYVGDLCGVALHVWRCEQCGEDRYGPAPALVENWE